MATRFKSTSEAVTTGFVVNALSGFAAGWLLAGSTDPRRLSFAVSFGLLLGLLAASAAYRRSVGRWNSVTHEIMSTAVIVVFVVAISRGLAGHL